jgi:protein-S-isoprenylcysteine O-methyltransferase Ste14
MPTPALLPVYSPALDTFLNSHRIAIWRGVLAVVAILLVVGESHWQHAPLSGLMVLLGIAAVSLATVGRLWCAVYISGRKGAELVDQGPYSVCRHPLYVCNALGLAGVGLLTESLVITGALALAFALLYPAVIRCEDRALSARLPGHHHYLQATPAFWPRFSRYRSDRTWVVDVPVFLRNLADSVWFILAGAFVEALDRLHEMGYLDRAVLLL